MGKLTLVVKILGQKIQMLCFCFFLFCLKLCLNIYSLKLQKNDKRIPSSFNGTSAMLELKKARILQTKWRTEVQQVQQPWVEMKIHNKKQMTGIWPANLLLILLF